MLAFAYFVLYSFVFAFGICISSFLCAYAYRYENEIPIWKGHSFCPGCHARLKASDLVPIFSYLFLGGKCRYCKNKISKIYPLTELAGGLLCLLIFFSFGFTIKAVLFSLVFLTLMVVAIIDWRTMEIPNGCNAFLAALGVCNVLIGNVSLKSAAIGFFVVALPMYLLNLAVADAFGGGDIKLMAAGGILLGWKGILLGFFVGLLLGGANGTYLLLSKKAEKGAHMPFGPHLALGIMVSSLYGEKIIYAYLSLFGLV